ncbi:hypothetical protein B0H12DRAFT_1133522 [Mycena haematopus]|nr:hypothetical protein B0H12DRAFT_1133522 [Mycena haematopus]
MPLLLCIRLQLEDMDLVSCEPNEVPTFFLFFVLCASAMCTPCTPLCSLCVRFYFVVPSPLAFGRADADMFLPQVLYAFPQSVCIVDRRS